ncbi:MAG: dehydrogenase [Armatimonadetes bacterium]|jgi:hypothetical protein|nr:dehydrogenase [Armatimonadota bacterium]
MRYVCLVYHEEAKLAALSDGELDALMAECAAWVDDLVQRGRHIFSAGLQSIRTATTLRSRYGTLSLSDGPFAETREFLGGFTLIDARDLNEAIRLASTLPAVRVGSVEVRPLLEPGTDLCDPLDGKLTAAMGREAHRAGAW